MSTKDSHGRSRTGLPRAFTLTTGQKGDAPTTDLIDGLPASVVMAVTPYDSDALRQAVADKNAAVIPNNAHLQAPARQASLRQRHLVECCFSKLKEFRHVATRFEKIARHYRAVITLAAIVLWLG